MAALASAATDHVGARMPRAGPGRTGHHDRGQPCGRPGVSAVHLDIAARLRRARRSDRHRYRLPRLCGRTALDCAPPQSSCSLLFLWTVNGPPPDLLRYGWRDRHARWRDIRRRSGVRSGVAAVGIAGVVLAAAHPRLLLATMPRKLVAAGAFCHSCPRLGADPGDNDARYAICRGSPRHLCGQRAPEVCVLREVPRPLDDLAEKAHARFNQRARRDRRAAAPALLAVATWVGTAQKTVSCSCGLRRSPPGNRR